MGDLISRQAAIDALADKPLAWTEGEYELGLQNQWQSDVDALKALPSAQPELEKKTGKEGQIYIDGVQDVMRPAPTLAEMIDILMRRHDALVAVWMTADTPEQYKLAREIGAIEKMLRLYGAM